MGDRSFAPNRMIGRLCFGLLFGLWLALIELLCVLEVSNKSRMVRERSLRCSRSACLAARLLYLVLRLTCGKWSSKDLAGSFCDHNFRIVLRLSQVNCNLLENSLPLQVFLCFPSLLLALGFPQARHLHRCQSLEVLLLLHHNLVEILLPYFPADPMCRSLVVLLPVVHFQLVRNLKLLQNFLLKGFPQDLLNESLWCLIE